MTVKKFNSSKRLPLDLILVPIIVVCCFYIVAFAFENSDQVIDRVAEKAQADSMITIKYHEESAELKRPDLVGKTYPRAANSTLTFNSMIRHRSNNHERVSRETYQPIKANRVEQVSSAPVSTFSIDVDTGGYTNIRRILEGGYLPERDQVRTEEMLNYFDYNYPAPQSQEQAFTITTGLTSSPWNANSHLLHVGLRAYSEDESKLPDSNIVALVDVSGSMSQEKKLPLVKQSLKLLTRHLRAGDKLSIVTYAGNTELVLEPTSGSEKMSIYQVINQLGAAGTTAGESGLRLAYQQAEKGFIENGNNRIIMMTDGDFNVGLSSVDALKKLIAEKRKSGVFLSAIGFGIGNYRDDMLEQIADHGNGFYFYIDSYREALKVFKHRVRSNLFAVAKDVKVQVEFNPAQVSEYRLLGYENRVLERQDFNNDKVDAGEVGQGHTVTAVYEITLAGNPSKNGDSRYVKAITPDSQFTNEIAFVQLRYKPINSDVSLLRQKAIASNITEYSGISNDFRLAIYVASFAELLRDSVDISGQFGYKQLLQLMEQDSILKGSEQLEFKSLVELASNSTNSSP
jgi:Ca-activated chloride channel family protein